MGMPKNADKVPDGSMVDAIIAYEQGAMIESEVIALFQGLVNSGLAWRLQGSYGRTARALIEAGRITVPLSKLVKPKGVVSR